MRGRNMMSFTVGGQPGVGGKPAVSFHGERPGEGEVTDEKGGSIKGAQSGKEGGRRESGERKDARFGERADCSKKARS